MNGVSNKSLVLPIREFLFLCGGMGLREVLGFQIKETLSQADTIRALHSLVKKNLLVLNGSVYQADEQVRNMIHRMKTQKQCVVFKDFREMNPDYCVYRGTPLLITELTGADNSSIRAFFMDKENLWNDLFQSGYICDYEDEVSYRDENITCDEEELLQEFLVNGQLSNKQRVLSLMMESQPESENVIMVMESELYQYIYSKIHGEVKRQPYQKDALRQLLFTLLEEDVEEQQ